MKTKAKNYVYVHLLMFFLSLAPVCSKLAGQQSFLSLSFIFFYGLTIFILGIYAILWQQIMKRMDLTAAYANKAITVVWGIVWGILLFQEHITLQKLLGALLIVGGVVLYALACKNDTTT